MPRKLRVQYPGAIYHVMNRGDRGEAIFVNDIDRHDFLKTLAEACEKTGWEVHAYCLLRNHFHLVVETPNANLVEGMKWLLSAYTIRLNHRHKQFGHVFSGRYQALLVEGSGTGYLRRACDYVHLNPARAQILKKADRLLAYPWSSFGFYLAAPEHRPRWIRVDRLLGEHGLQADTAPAREQFEARMEQRRLEPVDSQELKVFQRGWCLGSKTFKDQMVKLMEGKLGENHPAQQRRETAQAKAERIISEELKRLGCSDSALRAGPKCDPRKLALATRLRKETTLTIKSIAARLNLGTPRNATVRLQEWSRRTAAKREPSAPIGL